VLRPSFVTNGYWLTATTRVRLNRSRFTANSLRAKAFIGKRAKADDDSIVDKRRELRESKLFPAERVTQAPTAVGLPFVARWRRKVSGSHRDFHGKSTATHMNRF
jgi:hypothetical protein